MLGKPHQIRNYFPLPWIRVELRAALFLRGGVRQRVNSDAPRSLRRMMLFLVLDLTTLEDLDVG